ncbi:MAG: flagellar basal body-associated FliL family protein [Lachnospirales bacterium]
MDKNKIMLIIIIVLLVLLLGAIGFVGFKAMTMFNTEETVEEEFVGTTEVLLPAEITTIALDSAISTNLKQGADGQNHNIKVSIAFGIDSRDPKAEGYEEFLAAFNANLPVLVRSTCLSIIRSKTFEEMSMPDSEDILAQEILVELQDVFKSNFLNSVYVSDMYVQ